MKTFKYSIAILMTVLIAVPGCKKFELKPDNLTLSADLNIFKTVVNFSFVDAATGKMIDITPASDLKVEVISPINGLVVNSMGEYQTIFNPNYGFFSFSLNPYSTIPTAQKSISLLVKTTLSNHLESITTVTLSEERVYNNDIKMISIPEPPTGVIIEEHDDVGTTSTSGATKEVISENTEGSEVGIEIEAGTILKDEKGLPLSGKVSIEMMSVNVSSADGYKNVPALNQPLITESGKISSLFNPIAYTRIEIRDGSGRIATSITGKDIVITTALNSSVINPKTNKPIAAGDQVPSYYFDGKDGNWKFFGKDTVSEENGRLQLVKVIKSKKSTGDESFGEITYTFDQSTPMDIQVLINLPSDKPSLPTTFNLILTGVGADGVSSELFNGDITLFTRSTSYTVTNLMADFDTYQANMSGVEMVLTSGISQKKTMTELAASQYQYTFDFISSQFKNPVEGDGPTRLYLQFACVPSSGSALFMDSPNLPGSFYLIFSGTGFTGESILQIEGGSFVIPFNPMLKTGGTWEAKVVMGSMEYPKGSGRVSVANSDFQSVDGKIIFTYSPGTAEGCDDFKKALGIN